MKEKTIEFLNTGLLSVVRNNTLKAKFHMLGFGSPADIVLFERYADSGVYDAICISEYERACLDELFATNGIDLSRVQYNLDYELEEVCKRNFMASQLDYLFTHICNGSERVTNLVKLKIVTVEDYVNFAKDNHDAYYALWAEHPALIMVMNWWIFQFGFDMKTCSWRKV